MSEISKFDQSLTIRKIDAETINIQINNNSTLMSVVGEFNGNLKDLEKEAIIRTLRFFNNNRRKTASSLGVSERTLYRKIEDYDLEPKIKRNNK